MPVARITSLALLDARNLPLGAWYPVLERAEDTPQHYAWIVIDDQPRLIWSGHLEIRGAPPAE